MQKEESIGAEQLLIIITTSPIQSNPSTEVVDLAIDSIRQQPSLSASPIYIICDGAKVGPLSKYKSGLVSTQSHEKYQLYKAALRDKYSADSRITIEERNERYCFANNIQHVMRKVSQPYVMIFQHDHHFERLIDCRLILKLLKEHSEVNYVGFINKSVMKLPHTLDQNMKLRAYFSDKVSYLPVNKHWHDDFRAKVLHYYQHKYALPLIPLLFWYDKVHIARRSYYLDVIFNPKGVMDLETGHRNRTQSFVEDSFGTIMQRNIEMRPEMFEELGAYMLWDRPESAIRHSNGRGFITEEVRQRRIEEGRVEGESEEREEVEMQVDMFYLNQ